MRSKTHKAEHLGGRHWRSLWAAIGAAVAISLGAGGVIGYASADEAKPGFTFEPITPCRLFDTKPGTSHVGSRNLPIGPGETFSIQATGAVGQCTIPPGARMLSVVVRIISGSRLSSVYVFPQGGALPQKPTLQALMPGKSAASLVRLSALGGLSVYNSRSKSHLAVDVTGYYLNPDDRYYTKTEIDTIISENPGPAGPSGGGGPAGPTGASGLVGASGLSGATGATGPAGGSGATGPVGETGAVGPAWTRCHASQRWDENRCKSNRFDTGDTPIGIAFDGVDLWVSNAVANSVSRINPDTGAKTDYPVGVNPQMLAFDGTNVWVANFADNDVSRINVSSGVRTDFPTPDGPYGVAFDGSRIWVSAINANKVSRFDVVSGARSDFATGANPYFVLYDGQNILTADTNYLTGNKISVINPSTGNQVTSFNAATNPQGMAFDGVSLWVTLASGGIKKLAIYSGGSTSFTVGGGPRGVVYDGNHIWVMNSADDTVSVVDTGSGWRADVPACGNPQFGVFDGTKVWVTCYDDDQIMSFIP